MAKPGSGKQYRQLTPSEVKRLEKQDPDFPKLKFFLLIALLAILFQIWKTLRTAEALWEWVKSLLPPWLS